MVVFRALWLGLLAFWSPADALVFLAILFLSRACLLNQICPFVCFSDACNVEPVFRPAGFGRSASCVLRKRTQDTAAVLDTQPTRSSNIQQHLAIHQ